MIVLCAYIALMIYQGYHSATDIFTTAAVIAPPVMLWRWWAAGTERAGLA